MQQETELASPPSDGITSVSFSRTNTLLATSWDASLRLYDPQLNQPQGKVQLRAPVLDGKFIQDDLAAAGGADCCVHLVYLTTGTDDVVGTHEKAVRCVNYDPLTGTVLSGGWDARVKSWDPRAPKEPVRTVELPGKVFTMDMVDDKLVVGTSSRHVHVYDARNLAEPLQRRESSLKYQTRCIRCYPGGGGYALSSIEGRVAMEYFDPSPESQAKKYAFKCHRTTVNGIDTVYPVNCIAFHSVYGTFATGGCDGIVNVWDGQNKKRLCQYHKYPTSIAALAFNANGTLLAIASSYTFEEGEKDSPSDSIYVRTVQESDVKPRPKGSQAPH